MVPSEISMIILYSNVPKLHLTFKNSEGMKNNLMESRRSKERKLIEYPNIAHSVMRAAKQWLIIHADKRELSIIHVTKFATHSDRSEEATMEVT